jgi:hypothetical protein
VIRHNRDALVQARLRRNNPQQRSAPLKTVAAFGRQVDQLCVVTRQALPDRASVLDVRDAITGARAHLNSGTGLDNRDVAKCVERFLRILAVADTQLAREQVAELEQYVHRSLTVEPPVVEASAKPFDG